MIEWALSRRVFIDIMLTNQTISVSGLPEVEFLSTLALRRVDLTKDLRHIKF